MYGQAPGRWRSVRGVPLVSYAAEKLSSRDVVRICDYHPADENPWMRLEHVHDRFTIEQVKIIQAHYELRAPRRKVIHPRFGGEPRLYIDRAPRDPAHVAQHPEAVVAPGNGPYGQRLQAAE